MNVNEAPEVIYIDDSVEHLTEVYKKKYHTKYHPEWLSKDEVYTSNGSYMIRPKFNPWVIILNILIPILASIPLAIGSFYLLNLIEWFKNIDMADGWKITLLAIILLAIYVLARSGGIAIFVVRIYQRRAPFEMRDRCAVFPNCSEYMILAIKKYGLIPGVIMGRKRYNRCGCYEIGEDWP